MLKAPWANGERLTFLAPDRTPRVFQEADRGMVMLLDHTITA
jgi:hypothetical protein